MVEAVVDSSVWMSTVVVVAAVGVVTVVVVRSVVGTADAGGAAGDLWTPVRMTISTRRFALRPFAVAFDSIGF